MKKSKMSGGKVLAVEAGMAALGAGAYYLLGPNAKKHQKKTSALMAKVKKEVETDAKKLKKEWKSISQKVSKKSVSKKKIVK